MPKKRSFFDRLMGNNKFENNKEGKDDDFPSLGSNKKINSFTKNNLEIDNDTLTQEKKWDEEIDAELTVDVYQTTTDIVLQTMVAGVQPDNLSISITRDMITIRGKREENQSITKDNYFVQELYWGSFSRTISLPEEIDPEEAEAVERHGLLIIKLPQ